MKKYYANFSSANASYFSSDLAFTNLAKAIREVRKIAESNRFAGTSCMWTVRDANGMKLACGGMTYNGRRVRFI